MCIPHLESLDSHLMRFLNRVNQVVPLNQQFFFPVWIFEMAVVMNRGLPAFMFASLLWQIYATY